MTRYRVILSTPGRIDMNGHFRFIADRSEVWANTWYRRCMASIDSLETNPQRCGFAPEEDDVQQGIRETYFGRKPQIYRNLFRIQGDTVQILHIRHGRQDTLSPDEF